MPGVAQASQSPGCLIAFWPRMYEFHRRAEARGEPLQAVVTLGIHPIHYTGSMAYHYAPNVRKYEIIGALFGEPYQVARCGTASLEVPEGAEIVIDGKIQ